MEDQMITLKDVMKIHDVDADLAAEVAERFGLRKPYMMEVYELSSDEYEAAGQDWLEEHVIERDMALAPEDMMRISSAFFYDDVEFVLVGHHREFAIRVENIWDEVQWYHAFIHDGQVCLSLQNCLSDIESRLRNPQPIQSIAL